MIFHDITANKVNCIHGLFLFLRKLKVCGTMYTQTVRCATDNTTYTLIFDKYDPSTKNQLTIEERLESLLRADEKLGDWTY